MFNITKTLIKRNASDLIYQRGVRYYNLGKVSELRYNPDENSVSANIVGTDIYETTLYFNEEGIAKSYTCTCPYEFFCKHTVALMLEIEEWDREGYFGQNPRTKSIQNSIFEYFSHEQEAPSKELVKLEATLTLNPRYAYDNPDSQMLSLRVGTDRLYVVKDILEFAGKILAKSSMEFGQQFNYDPFIHDFDSNDIQLLREIHELGVTESHISSGGGYYRSKSFFNKKKVSLPRHLLVKILDLYVNRTILIDPVERSGLIEATVRESNIPITLIIDMDKEDLVLKFVVENSPVILDPSCSYILADDVIYKNSPGHSRNIKPFIETILKQRSSEIRFKDHEKERFVSEVLPYAEEIGEVIIADEVSSSILKLPLQAEVYLDKNDGLYTAGVTLKYNERSINPFASVKETIPDTGRILVRDIKKENNLMNALANTPFKVRGENLYMENEDDMFEFLSSGIHEVAKYADLFYSDDVRNIKIRNSISMKGSVSLSSDTSLLDFEFSFDDIDPKELKHIFNSMKERKRYHKLRNGSFLDLSSDNLSEVSEFMESLGIGAREISKGSMTLPGFRALYLDGTIRADSKIRIERDHRFKDLVQNISEPQDMKYPLPEGLDDILRDYQKFGFKWLKTLSRYNMGGILADDMGLGKTLQVLAYILSEKNENSKPALIVVPTSLIYNWKAEITKFVPSLTALIVYGTKGERTKALESISEYDVAITSYNLIRRDIDIYKNLVFDMCIIDEAQHIKNHRSKTARALKKISAGKRFALTGTPMENNLSELWSIFDFIMPKYLFSHNKFSDKYERPIVKNGDQNAANDLSNHIKPFILRRMKKDVLKELPEKIESKMISDLTKEQKKVYLVWLQKLKGEIFDEINEAGFEKSRIKILAGLTRLRQICCHPSLFLEDYKKESGKLLQFEEIVTDAVEGGHRILIFSQFTSMLAIIKQKLIEHDISYFYLDGSTKAIERGRMADAFNNGESDVFLISLKAGGTGLNLTGADMVIHYDPWWNPAVEDQATDRAHRIGQDKAVQVIKMISSGTIEEKIFNLQKKKKALVDSVLKPGETLITKLSKEEIENLFSTD